MTDAQWQLLLQVIAGERTEPLPVGLIIDSPWLPNWAGQTILDYLADDQMWLDANLRAISAFPDILFLPGFWSEYGMCTEPSAFGGKCVFYEDAFPSVHRIIEDYPEIGRIKKPNCKTDGLLPFVLRRLVRSRAAIETAGHRVRFAVARGPLNVASYLLGHTEFLMGVKTNPEDLHRLLGVVTDFLVDWIGLQCDTFDSIDGIFLLDDLIGFLRDDDFRLFALPYLKRIYGVRPLRVKFLHNDAAGMITAKYLAEMGVNFFNFSFNHSLPDMRKAAGEPVVLLGNIPPRDVLAQGTADDVRRSVAAMLAPVSDRRRIIVSCGGGAPPGAPAANLHALCEAARA